MKIIRILTSFQTELKYHDHYLSEIMQEDGVETTFLTSNKMEKEFLPFLDNKKIKAGEDSYKGSRIIRLRSIAFMGKFFIIEFGGIYKELCNKKYNLIHIYGIGNPITFITLIILKICKKDFPVIINDHSNPNLKNMSLIGSLYYKINIFLFSKLNSQVKFIVTPNAASNAFVQKQYGIQRERMKVIPLGYDHKIFTHNINQKNESKNLILGFAGKVFPGKKLELLIDVLSELNESSIDCEIVGFNEPETDYQKSLREYANKSNVEVLFKPLIKDSFKLAEFYNYIDVAVFPGSISITTLEANGCGTPVILYESIEGLEDRVEEGRGYLFTTKEELKNCILKFVEMKRNNLILNAEIEEKSKKYSWQKISGTYLRLYNFVCE